MLNLQECQKCEDIKLIEPFIVKTNQFLKSEYNISVQSIDIKQLKSNIEISDINFVTTLSGALNTNLIFSFDRSLSKTILDSIKFLTYTAENLEELLFEVVSEFLNLIVGRAMKDLPSNETLRFSPPIEIVGNSKLFCNNTYNICKTEFFTSKGCMSIIFSTEK